MQQDHGLAAARADVMQVDAVDVDPRRNGRRRMRHRRQRREQERRDAFHPLFSRRWERQVYHDPDCNPAGIRRVSRAASAQPQEGTPMPRYFVVALVLLAAGTVHAAEKTLDRTFAVSPGGSLIVEADGASIKVS